MVGLRADSNGLGSRAKLSVRYTALVDGDASTSSLPRDKPLKQRASLRAKGGEQLPGMEGHGFGHTKTSVSEWLLPRRGSVRPGAGGAMLVRCRALAKPGRVTRATRAHRWASAAPSPAEDQFKAYSYSDDATDKGLCVARLTGFLSHLLFRLN